MTRRFRPTTLALLVLAGLTTVIWLLRGFSVLTFVPGGILHLLVVLTCAIAIFNFLQWTR